MGYDARNWIKIYSLLDEYCRSLNRDLPFLISKRTVSRKESIKDKGGDNIC